MEAFLTCAFPGSSAVMPLGGSVVFTHSTAGAVVTAATYAVGGAENAGAEGSTPPATRAAEAESIRRRCVRERSAMRITSHDVGAAPGADDDAHLRMPGPPSQRPSLRARMHPDGPGPRRVCGGPFAPGGTGGGRGRWRERCEWWESVVAMVGLFRVTPDTVYVGSPPSAAAWAPYG